jgi:hypothetical protein
MDSIDKLLDEAYGVQDEAESNAALLPGAGAWSAPAEQI